MYKYLFLFLFILGNSNFISAQVVEKDLIGFWEVTKIISLRENGRRIEREPLVMEFRENGVFIMGKRGEKNSKTKKASWELEDADVLILMLNNDAEVVQIKKCSKRKLVLLDKRSTTLKLRRI
jgi:hypothetical protein